MELFLFVYLQPTLCKLGLKNDSFDFSQFCLPMIIWAFFQTIFLVTKNATCPISSAPEVFPISIWVVTHTSLQSSVFNFRRSDQLWLREGFPPYHHMASCVGTWKWKKMDKCENVIGQKKLVDLFMYKDHAMKELNVIFPLRIHFAPPPQRLLLFYFLHLLSLFSFFFFICRCASASITRRVCPSVPPSQLAKSAMSRNNTTSKQPRLNDKSGNKQNSISIIVVITIIVIIVVVKATLSSRRRQVIVVKYN